MRVDERGAGAGEEAGRRVQVAGGGHRDPQRVRRPARGRPGGHPGRVADQQPRVVVRGSCPRRPGSRRRRRAARPPRPGPRGPDRISRSGEASSRQPSRETAQLTIVYGRSAHGALRVPRHGPASGLLGPVAVIYWLMAGHAVSPTVSGVGRVARDVRVGEPGDRRGARHVRDRRRSARSASRCAGPAARRPGGAGSPSPSGSCGCWPGSRTSPGTWGGSRSWCTTRRASRSMTRRWRSSTRSCTWTGRPGTPRPVLRPRRVPSGIAMLNQAASVEYQPLGVIGVIGPWNYPVFTPMGSIGYALAAGNAVVFKPSELTTGVGQWLVQSFTEVLIRGVRRHRAGAAARHRARRDRGGAGPVRGEQARVHRVGRHRAEGARRRGARP